MTLYHKHVPKLVDEGYLTYEEDRSSVALTNGGESLGPVLAWADERRSE